jgi:hypothetical protein
MKLNETFNIKEAKEELQEIKDVISNEDAPNEILMKNILRAERLLDKIEEENDCAYSARNMEVASALINAITQASNSMIANNVSLETTEQKAEILDLKKLEFELKKNKLESSRDESKAITNNTQNNIIVSDRESLLSWLNTQQGELTNE